MASSMYQTYFLVSDLVRINIANPNTGPWGHIEIVFWNIAIHGMGRLQQLIPYVRRALYATTRVIWSTVVIKLLIWSGIGLAIGLFLGLIGISTW
jgi:hypothetical protein